MVSQPARPIAAITAAARMMRLLFVISRLLVRPGMCRARPWDWGARGEVPVSEVSRAPRWNAAPLSRVHSSTGVAQPRRKPVDREVDAALHALLGAARAVALQQLQLQVVERVEVGEEIGRA